MTKYREILKLNHQQISGRSIASILGCSRNTVSKTLEASEKQGLTWPLPLDISDEELEQILFPERSVDPTRMLPDYETIHRELAKNGVTMTLLWDEYCIQCRDLAKIPYMYTQFCKMYRDYAMKNKATMHIHHKPGDTCEVDWAGDTAAIIDNVTGEIIDAYVFVAALPCSSYAYVEAFLTMDTESGKWVRLGDIGEIIGGGTPKTGNGEYWNGGNIPWLTPADMKHVEGKYVTRGERFITEKGLKSSSARLMTRGSIIYSSRAPIGYIAIAHNDLATNQGFKSLFPYVVAINEYIYYVLISRTNEIISRATGTTFKEISGSEFSLTVIPLPPLDEQKRIVSKVESLLLHAKKLENNLVK